MMQFPFGIENNMMDRYHIFNVKNYNKNNQSQISSSSDTYSSQDTNDNNSQSKNKSEKEFIFRSTFETLKPDQCLILERVLGESGMKMPSQVKIKLLSSNMNVSQRKLRIWFKNRLESLGIKKDQNQKKRNQYFSRLEFENEQSDTERSHIAPMSVMGSKSSRQRSKLFRELSRRSQDALNEARLTIRNIEQDEMFELLNNKHDNDSESIGRSMFFSP